MIILSYGQPKSASTFLYVLLKRAAETLGSNQDSLRERIFQDAPERKNEYWRGDLSSLRSFSGRLMKNEYLAVKSHGAFRKNLVDKFKKREIVPFISYRNVGDAALSVFEAGERARKAEDYNEGFYKILTHQAAIDYIGGHVIAVTVPWLKSGYGHAFSYDEVSNHPERILAAVADVTGAELDFLLEDKEIQMMLKGEHRTYNFNKGIAGRHREIFSAEDLQYLDVTYGRFNRFCDGEIGIDDV